MNQPRRRIADPTRLIREDLTIPNGSYTTVGSVQSEGYDHIDFVIVFPTGVGAATQIDARFSEVGGDTAFAASIDVEDVDLTLGTAPGVQYVPSKNVTGLGAGRSVTFRIRTNGARVSLQLQLTGASVSDATVYATRG